MAELVDPPVGGQARRSLDNEAGVFGASQKTKPVSVKQKQALVLELADRLVSKTSALNRA